MRILYAIQGTGNGHLARAMEVVPQLQKMADTDVMVSGIQGDLELPFPVKYRLYGISFIFGSHGGVDFWKTLKRFRFFRFLRDISRLAVKDYDLVISDFEPVSAWACRLRQRKCIGLSHQSAVLHRLAPKPVCEHPLGKFILKHYAPTRENYGFHFRSYGADVFTPVIRPDIREAKPTDGKHYTVYLPSYDNREIARILSKFEGIDWEVFSKHSKKSYREGNIRFSPVSLEAFAASFVNCAGILCNAGFETPAEALYMGKKLCVIPMRGQFEQACNAAALSEMGVPVVTDLHKDFKLLKQWLGSNDRIQVNYHHGINEILGMVLMKHIYDRSQQEKLSLVNRMQEIFRLPFFRSSKQAG